MYIKGRQKKEKKNKTESRRKVISLVLHGLRCMRPDVAPRLRLKKKPTKKETEKDEVKVDLRVNLEVNENE